MEKLDLSKILCQCPIGTPLYSTAFGTVIYRGLFDGNKKSVIVTTMANKDETSPSAKQYFRYDGTLASSQEEAECVLFPSYYQRDWNLFKAPKPKMSVTLHPFDKILVRDSPNEEWCANMLSHIDESNRISPFSDTVHPFVTISSSWNCCVPYNENTAHLLGTTEEPAEEYEFLFSKDFNVI